MRKTIIGCVSGAALVLALAACSTSSFSPAAASSPAVGTHSAPASSAPAAPAATTPAPAAFAPGSGFTSCGSGVYAGPDTSCPFALNVWRAATADGNTPVVTAYSPVTGQSYSLALTSTNPVTYNGASNGNTALVEWWPASSAPAAGAPATPAATAPAAPATAAAVPQPVPVPANIALWCGNVTSVVHAPSLKVWKTAGQWQWDSVYLSLPGFRTGAAFMENSNYNDSPAAAVLADAGAMCDSGIRPALGNPPPVDQAQFLAAMASFAKATQIIHGVSTGSNYTAAQNAARPYFVQGVDQLNVFLAAIGG